MGYFSTRNVYERQAKDTILSDPFVGGPVDESAGDTIEDDPFAIDNTGSAVSARCNGERTVLVELHIVYCSVFKVPTLMFKFTTPDGSPLTMESVGFKPPDAYSDTWPSVTLQEHPVIPDMLYTFHACQTAEKLHTMACLSCWS